MKKEKKKGMRKEYEEQKRRKNRTAGNQLPVSPRTTHGVVVSVEKEIRKKTLRTKARSRMRRRERNLVILPVKREGKSHFKVRCGVNKAQTRTSTRYKLISNFPHAHSL